MMNRWRLSAATLAVAVATAMSTPAAAQTATQRASLPIAPPPFSGVIKEDVSQSTPAPQQRLRALAGAPNILLFMSDDVGFGLASAFGGPVPTPALERLAATGQRYNRFHSTGICSPTRAALLTGRNHHNAGTGYLTDSPNNFPGYSGRIPASTATLAQVLRLNGYNTAMFGKHHNVAPGEDTAAGPFDTWPTGLGFEYFYGFIGADADQFSPVLYRGTVRQPDQPGPQPMLDRRLADDAITWVHNQKGSDPDKPFFLYWAPGTLHAPHQAPADYIARYRGKFDQGWDVVREETWRRQLTAGIIPPGTKLTARPDGIPAWASLTAQQRAYSARMMEVAAAAITYQDEQLGRVLDELQRMGVLDDTLVMVMQGDNGASGEGGPRGTLSEVNPLGNGIKESDAQFTAELGRMGGPHTSELYPVGWAWAMNAPLRWTKQYASMLGGIRNDLVVSWQGHVAQPGSVCAQFGHVVDFAPTAFEAAGIPAPVSVYGVAQKPLDGKSLLSSLARCRPDTPRTQYFEMIGKRGLWKDGWFASNDDQRKPWERQPPTGPNAPGATWSLYDLNHDFSQSEDLAAHNPAKLKELVATFQAEATRNNVYPLDHSFATLRGTPAAPRAQFDYWGGDVSVPMLSGPFFGGRSFTLDADVDLTKADASGVILAVGSHFAGFSLFLDNGRPTLVYTLSTAPEDSTRIASSAALKPGSRHVRLSMTTGGFGQPGEVKLFDGDQLVASGRVPRTFVIPAGLGEQLDTGRDTGVTVTDYATPHGELDGNVRHVSIAFQGPPPTFATGK